MRPIAFKGNIIIWNIPESFTEAQLAALFDEFGLVVGAKIDRWPDEPGRVARGLVDLAPPKAVETAIAALDGSRVEDCKLKVRRIPEAPPRPKAAKPAAAPPAITAAPAARRKPIVEYRSLPTRRIAMPQGR
jgi:RNA recognition motif. (a.k.a. RRM, RBD, or RNP domain)